MMVRACRHWSRSRTDGFQPGFGERICELASVRILLPSTVDGSAGEPAVPLEVLLASTTGSKRSRGVPVFRPPSPGWCRPGCFRYHASARALSASPDRPAHCRAGVIDRRWVPEHLCILLKSAEIAETNRRNQGHWPRIVGLRSARRTGAGAALASALVIYRSRFLLFGAAHERVRRIDAIDHSR